MTATLLARCNGPRSYFPTASAMLAAQEDWIQKAIAFQEADKARPPSCRWPMRSPPARKDPGSTSWSPRRGLAWPRAKACLANKPEQDRLSAMAKEAWGTRQIPGTPGFPDQRHAGRRGGELEGLEPKLQEALR